MERHSVGEPDAFGMLRDSRAPRTGKSSTSRPLWLMTPRLLPNQPHRGRLAHRYHHVRDVGPGAGLNRTLTVHLAEEPLTCNALGAGRCLEELETIRSKSTPVALRLLPGQ